MPEVACAMRHDPAIRRPWVLGLMLLALVLIFSGLWRIARRLDPPEPPARATLVRSGPVPGAYFPSAFAS